MGLARNDSKKSLGRKDSQERRNFLPSIQKSPSAANSALFPTIKGQTTPNGSQIGGKASSIIGFENSPERKQVRPPL